MAVDAAVPPDVTSAATGAKFTWRWQTRSMHYIRVYNDDGRTRFEDDEVSFVSAVFAPPAPPLDVSTAMPARQVMFIRFRTRAGPMRPIRHPPASGCSSCRAEVRPTAGGETRSWGPGQVFLLEDTATPGHGTTVFEDAVIAVVRC